MAAVLANALKERTWREWFDAGGDGAEGRGCVAGGRPAKMGADMGWGIGRGANGASLRVTIARPVRERCLGGSLANRGIATRVHSNRCCTGRLRCGLLRFCTVRTRRLFAGAARTSAMRTIYVIRAVGQASRDKCRLSRTWTPDAAGLEFIHSQLGRPASSTTILQFAIARGMNVTHSPRAFSNPSRLRKGKSANTDELYRYYAGYTSAFVEDALAWCEIPPGGHVLDPWNGAGTTTRVAQSRKIHSIGYDLNPTMVIVGISNLVHKLDFPVILPLARKMVTAASNRRDVHASSQPLRLLFSNETSDFIAALANAIIEHLVVENRNRQDLKLNLISPLPALFFVGLFNAIRRLSVSLGTSNPTWLKIPPTESERVNISNAIIAQTFVVEMERLAALAQKMHGIEESCVSSKIQMADAKLLPLSDASVDAVITSPPYCTRLDYARSTLPELLALESIGLASYDAVRRKLTGTSTTRKMEFDAPPDKWGSTCIKLLKDIHSHHSRASRTYYYSSHFNYFQDLSESISELSRVLKTTGRACIVVQDSHYKDLHNDLPIIVEEMASVFGLQMQNSFRYPKRQSIRSINSASKVYRQSKSQTEVAILLKKGQ